MAKTTRLYLVIDDGSGEASMFALARDEAHAIEQTKHILACEDGDTSFLRVVTADTATNEQTRATLALLGPIAEEAAKSYSDEFVSREMNGLEALLPALTKLGQTVATERAACFEIAEKIARHAYGDDYTRGRAEAAFEIAQAIAARSKQQAAE